MVGAPAAAGAGGRSRSGRLLLPNSVQLVRPCAQQAHNTFRSKAHLRWIKWPTTAVCTDSWCKRHCQVAFQPVIILIRLHPHLSFWVRSPT